MLTLQKIEQSITKTDIFKYIFKQTKKEKKKCFLLESWTANCGNEYTLSKVTIILGQRWYEYRIYTI